MNLNLDGLIADIIDFIERCDHVCEVCPHSPCAGCEYQNLSFRDCLLYPAGTHKNWLEFAFNHQHGAGLEPERYGIRHDLFNVTDVEIDYVEDEIEGYMSEVHYSISDFEKKEVA